MTLDKIGITVCLAAVAWSSAGCTGDAAKSPSGTETSPPPGTVDVHAAHPSEGPHHGELIELGNEEYHAELVHGSQSVTIYLLNGAADQQVPVEAIDITINTTHEGKPEQFKLMATPDENDPVGMSSRFVSQDPDLAAHLDDPDADHRLVLTIDGKSYRGQISHDHAGHDHAGHDH